MAIVWEQRKLGEISSLITKGTTPKDKSGDGEINFIKVENIDDSSGEITGMSKISLEEHQGYLKRSQLQEDDILFSIAGTLGRVTSVNKGILPANTNQALSIIRLKEGNLEYVKTCLKGNVVVDFIRRNPTVGAQPNLSLEQVSSLEISMPSKEEQEKIGAYFHHLDHLITLHQWKSKIYEMIMAITERQRKPLKIDIKMQIKVFYIVNLVYRLEIVCSFYHKIIRLRFYKAKGNNMELVSFKDKCLIFIIGIVNIICFILFYHQYLMCIKILSIFVKINIFITRRR